MIAFCYRLASQLQMPVRRMLRELSATEFNHWAAYYKVEAEEVSKEVRKHAIDR